MDVNDRHCLINILIVELLRLAYVVSIPTKILYQRMPNVHSLVSNIFFTVVPLFAGQSYVIDINIIKKYHANFQSDQHNFLLWFNKKERMNLHKLFY